jgi:signal transduction histidine kinase
MTRCPGGTVSGAAEIDPERVLVFTPTGRDAGMIRERLLADGMACEPCGSLEAVLEGISAGAGAVVIAQEALPQDGAQRLLTALEAQQPWSDIPVLLLSEASSRQRPQVVTRFFERANVTLLQRPLGIQLFLSSARSAVRARRRQYQMRDLVRELERAVQLSDMFVGILGHDLRTPLSAITLSAEVIVRLSLDARALRPAGRILSSAGRMTRMIEQLLDFARVRQGRGIPLHRRQAHLGELARQIVQEIEDANPQAGVRVLETGDLAGSWDPDRLGQVISNLAGNAVQHGTHGQPVTVELDGSERSSVRVRVHSAGSVPAESFPTLFEAFKRSPDRASAASGSTGLGLGLFIAREIARAHGGDIAARSAADCTTFEVSLPRSAG